MNRIGDWMQTRSGKKFWPCDPRPEDVDIDDIIWALSMQCRFGGHCSTFYSVGQHSVLASRLATAEHGKVVALAALLHDASEAYVVDVPRPLKRFLTGYKEIEARVARAVEARFGLPEGATEWPEVKAFDETMLATEARDIMGGESAGKWTLNASPLPERLELWNRQFTRQAFMDRFQALTSAV